MQAGYRVFGPHLEDGRRLIAEFDGRDWHQILGAQTLRIPGEGEGTRLVVDRVTGVMRYEKED